MTLLGKMGCCLGFHDWAYNQPVFPESKGGRVRYPKTCKRCQREVAG